MTLALGFRCTDGLVLAVDSEISVGYQRHDAIKAWLLGVPKEKPELWVGITGSGHVASIEHARQEIFGSLKPSMSKDDVLAVVKTVVGKLHKDHLYKVPAGWPEEERPTVDLLVGILARDGSRLVTTSFTMVNKVEDYHAIGLGLATARFLIDRSYVQRLSLWTAALLAVKVLMHARKSMQYIGGRPRVLIMPTHQAAVGPMRKTKLLEQETFVTELESAFGQLLLMGSLDVTSDQFSDAVDAFAVEAKKLKASDSDAGDDSIERHLTMSATPGHYEISGATVSTSVVLFPPAVAHSVMSALAPPAPAGDFLGSPPLTNAEAKDTSRAEPQPHPPSKRDRKRRPPSQE